MTKIEFLAMSLPSGLKVQYHDRSFLEMTMLKINRAINFMFPVIRHPSALTEPCVQSNYNGGEPFIPIVELSKVAVCDAERQFIVSLLNNMHDRNKLLRFAPLTFGHLLIKWHFWPDMPENESVVYIDDNINPYK